MDKERMIRQLEEIGKQITSLVSELRSGTTTSAEIVKPVPALEKIEVKPARTYIEGETVEIIDDQEKIKDLLNKAKILDFFQPTDIALIAGTKGKLTEVTGDNPTYTEETTRQQFFISKTIIKGNE